MPAITINPDSWTSLLTTVVDTVIENQSQREVYVTTEPTGSLGIRDGNLVPPFTDVVISGGKNVSVYVHTAPARIHFMDA